ncbi:MAG TPA: protein tyrosine phosphatase family protein [Thermoanaerobaculia bacterium]|nr:protein tyrosine phosphatase family protein [Thermoanaerobaculia bacterium]
MRIRNGLVIAALAALLGVGALARAAGEPATSTPSAPAAPKLESLTWGSVERMHRFDGLYLASQPSKEDFELARESGVRTVVNLRKPSEIDWDEKAVVDGLGMEYENLPFKEPEEMTDALLDAARRVLASAEKKPILLHCSSANRVGAVWLAHRVIDDGVAYPEALAEAETVGLKSPAFRDRVKEYVDRHPPK